MVDEVAGAELFTRPYGAAIPRWEQRTRRPRFAVALHVHPRLRTRQSRPLGVRGGVGRGPCTTPLFSSTLVLFITVLSLKVTESHWKPTQLIPPKSAKLS